MTNRCVPGADIAVLSGQCNENAPQLPSPRPTQQCSYGNELKFYYGLLISQIAVFSRHVRTCSAIIIIMRMRARREARRYNYALAR